MGDTEQKVLSALEHGVIEDTGPWSKQQGFDHNQGFDGVLKALESYGMVVLKKIETKVPILLPDGQEALKNGSPEFQLFNAVPAEGGIPKPELDAKVGPKVAKLGHGEAMRLKWVRQDKTGVFRNVESVQDTVIPLLTAVQNRAPISDKDAEFLGKRQMIQISKTVTYAVSKGPDYKPTFKKVASELTSAMLASGSWKDEVFKPFNLDTLGLDPQGGHLHPLMKVRTEIREIFIGMGFEEMPTNNYVESSFWNFDSLFQPQQHPARDAHDTFFLKDPATAASLPMDYLERVKEVHSKGGYGSIGYRYDWKIEEAQKISSRMLYKLAQKGFKPSKFFSIDRVFRNETLDATHLAEFHQIEDITLANLIGVISQFFKKLGINDIRFKPAYNPYTEPSMEIFGYHPILKRWVELGNSGMFRPEMLQPMGLPENVRVIAWGLSLERPTMIKYGIASIRDIFGPLIDLNFIKTNPIAFIDSREVEEAHVYAAPPHTPIK